MEEYTNDLKLGAYKRLDEREKEFIASSEFTATLREIGAKNGLLLDATGKLGDVIFLALVGLIKASEIPNELRKALGLPEPKITALVNETNERIFVPFRNILMQETAEEKPAEEAPKSNLSQKAETIALAPEPTREDILAEIENPTPAVHPISTAGSGVMGAMKPREVVPEPAKDPVSNEFVAGKLSETVSIPSAKATVPPPQPKTYAADPYREPFA